MYRCSSLGYWDEGGEERSRKVIVWGSSGFLSASVILLWPFALVVLFSRSFPCSCPFLKLSLVATVHLCFFLQSFSFVSPCMYECHWRRSQEAVRPCAVDLLLDGLGFITWADRPALLVRLHFHLSTFSCANLAGGSLLLFRCCPLESTQSVFLGITACSW